MREVEQAKVDDLKDGEMRECLAGETKVLLASVGGRFHAVGAEQVEAVTLEGGEKIAADVVVVGVGVRPATGFLEGVALGEDGGVIVDAHLRAADSLYAAGDIARFTDARTKENSRIEHSRTALQQGRTAARNMAGRATVNDAAPFFWTTQFDATLTYVGHAANWDEIIFDGED